MTLTHPRLVHALMFLRPGTRPSPNPPFDFIVEDHGDGPTLLEGSMVNPPSQTEVDAVTNQQLDDAQSNKRTIEQKLASIGMTFGELKSRLAKPNGA